MPLTRLRDDVNITLGERERLRNQRALSTRKNLVAKFGGRGHRVECDVVSEALHLARGIHGDALEILRVERARILLVDRDDLIANRIARREWPSHQSSRAIAESFQECILLTRAGARAIVGFLQAAPDFRDQLLLIEREPSDLRAELSMPDRTSGTRVHGDAESRAFGFAAVAGLAVGSRTGAMKHYLEAQVRIRDAAMSAREAGNDIVPTSLQNLDGVEQLDERALLDDAFGLLNYAFGFERIEFRRAESEVLLVNLRIMLAVQRSRFHLDGRMLEAHWTSRHRELAAHRMLHGDHHPALLHMRIVEQLDAVEHRPARHTALAENLEDFMLGVLHGPGRDDLGQGVDIFCARTRIREAFVVREIWLAHRGAQVLPHFQVGTQDVAVIVVAAGRAFEEIAGTCAGAIADATGRLLRDVGAHRRNAHEVEDGLLHRHLDLLAEAGFFALDVRREHANRRMHSGAGVADGRAWLERRRSRKSGDRHRAARRLRDHVEAFVLAVRSEGAETLDRQVDDARIGFLQHVISEPEAFQRAEGEV